MAADSPGSEGGAFDASRSVASWARTMPATAALVVGGTTRTWEALDDRVTVTALALRDLGVGRGHRVACLLPNCVEFVEVMLATLRLGAIFVPLNSFFAPPELERVLTSASVDVVVTSSQFGEAVRAVADRISARWITVDQPSPGLTTTLESLRARTAARDVGRSSCEDADVAMIAFTSGTTGLPKGVMLTHGNLHFAHLSWLVDGGLRGTDRILTALPLCFLGGSGLVLASLYCGACVVLEQGFEPERILERLESERITVFSAVSTMLERLSASEALDRHDLSSLRLVAYGGSPLADGAAVRLRGRGLPLLNGYGLTEGSGGPNIYLPPELSRAGASVIGRPTCYIEAMIVGEEGSDVEEGAVGELLLRGPVVFAGYWDDPEQSAHAFTDGWFHTGDLAYRDGGGLLCLVGRLHDMIVTGGLNVYPAEVEAVLAQIPAIGAAAVIGLPDSRWGERVTAVVTTAATTGADTVTADQVIEYCRARLAAYKVPKRVEFVSELPLTSSGKVARDRLRHQLRPEGMRQ